MTPEQLRMLTDALASAGAAIGGKGSVGDLVGRTVIARNRRLDVAAEARKAKDEETARQAAQGKRWLEAMQRFANPGAGQATSQTAAKELQSGQSSSQLSMLTPPGQEGLTSIGMGKDGQVTTTYTPSMDSAGLSPEQLASALSSSRAERSSKVQNDYTKILTEQAKNSLATGSPTKVTIDGQDFVVTPAKAMDYARGKYGDVTASEQQARVTASELANIAGGGVVTKGKLGEFNLRESSKPTEVKVAEYALKHGDVGAEMLKRKRAGAITIKTSADKKKATEIAKLQAHLASPEYVSSLENRLKDNPSYIEASSIAAYSSDPVEQQGALKTINNMKNREIFNDYKNAYKADGAKIIIKVIDGKPHIVQKFKDGTVVDLRELEIN